MSGINPVVKKELDTQIKKLALAKNFENVFDSTKKLFETIITYLSYEQSKENGVKVESLDKVEMEITKVLGELEKVTTPEEFKDVEMFVLFKTNNPEFNKEMEVIDTTLNKKIKEIIEVK